MLLRLEAYCHSAMRLILPYAIARPFTRQFDGSVHTERTRLATFTKLNSGSWRAQVRRKGKYVNETPSSKGRRGMGA